MYTINEILEYESDLSGNLHCVFKLDGDDKGTVRVLSTDLYYEWLSKLDEYKEYYMELDEEEEEYNFNPEFNFESWKNENECEDIVKEFIYENYSIDDLPDMEEHPLG